MVKCSNCGMETSGDYCEWCKYPILSGLPRQKEVTVDKEVTMDKEVIMDKVVVKPTWALAWGLFWRIFLIGLGIYAIIFGIIFALGIALLPFTIGF